MEEKKKMVQLNVRIPAWLDDAMAKTANDKNFPEPKVRQVVNGLCKTYGYKDPEGEE